MNTFCGLFFATVLAYAQAVGDHHPCDPWAADLLLPGVPYQNQHGNQEIKYEEFVAKLDKPVAFFVAWATKGSDFDTYGKFCTPNAHGKDCGDIYFETKLIKHSYDQTLKKTVLEHQTNFYSENESNEKVTAFTIKFKLINSDDLIYKADENSIKAFFENIDVTEEIPPSVRESLSGPIAVFHQHDKFSIHLTCDLKYSWVNVKHEVLAKDVENLVKTELAKLAAIKKEDGPKVLQFKGTVVPIKTNYKSTWAKDFSSVLQPLIEVN